MLAIIQGVLQKVGKILSPQCCQILNARLARHPARSSCPHMECAHSGFFMAPAHLPKASTPKCRENPTDFRPTRWSCHCLDSQTRNSMRKETLFSLSSLYFPHSLACLWISFYSSPPRRSFLSNHSFLCTAFQEVMRHHGFVISMASCKHQGYFCGPD